MNLTRDLFLYCERVTAAFWAEPLNAVSNIAFIAAGVIAILSQGRRGQAGLGREVLAAALMAAGIIAFFAHTIGLLFALGGGPLYRPLVIPVYVLSVVFVGAGLIASPALFRDPAPDWPVAWLSGNAIVVGVGSFLFHTYATPWAGAADSGPIVMFILGYFTVTMSRFAGLTWREAGLATAGFLVAMLAAATVFRQIVPPLLGQYANSVSYYPACLALLAVGIWLDRARDHPAGVVLMRASGVFALSLVFRTLDRPACEWFPIGTHFLWHLCNGLLLWMLIDAVIRHGTPTRAVRAAPA